MLDKFSRHHLKPQPTIKLKSCIGKVEMVWNKVEGWLLTAEQAFQIELLNANTPALPQDLLHQIKQAMAILDPAYKPLSGTCNLLANEHSPSLLSRYISRRCTFREPGSVRDTNSQYTTLCQDLQWIIQLHAFNQQHMQSNQSWLETQTDGGFLT